MADIREKLAEALAEHYEIAARRFADVLLSLPGIAIVELPEDAACWTIDDVCNVSVYRGELGIVLRPGEYGVELINVGPDLVMAPAESRQLAAALLAAAAAAEAADHG